jgi:hypothetical protein
MEKEEQKGKGDVLQKVRFEQPWLGINLPGEAELCNNHHQSQRGPPSTIEQQI